MRKKHTPKTDPQGLNLLAEPSADEDILRHPCLFPHRLPYWAASELVASSRRLEALRQGLDEEALILRFP